MTLKTVLTTIAALCLVVTGAAGSAGAATVHGTEHFTITIAGSHEGVVAHGLFHGAGRDDPNHSNYDVLHLGRGHLRIVHPDSRAHFAFKFYPRSCYARISGHGSYTLRHGTGRFRGVRGHGTYTIAIKSVQPRKADGSCNLDAAGYEVGVISAHGPVSV